MTENKFWKSKDAVDRYQQAANIIIPDRRYILSKIANLAIMSLSAQPKILDLGCGSGDVTAEIIKQRPDTSAFMVDLSEEMIQLVSERFRSNKNIEVISSNLDDGIPDNLLSNKFDVVISTFALHHVEYEKRVGLYSQIKQILCDGGLFINGDMFIGESPGITDWERDNMVGQASKRFNSELGLKTTPEQVKHQLSEESAEQGDKPGTIWKMCEDLRQSGFQDVDCIWMNYHLGIVVGSKK